MLLSMTGFGSAHRHEGNRLFSVEIRSVNHRYCDVRFNVPRDLESLVPALEAIVRGQIRRGRVDVAIAASFPGDTAFEPTVDVARARGYWTAYQKLAEALGRPVDISLSTIAQSPGVFRTPELRLDPKDDLPLIREIVEEAVTQLVAMRQAEGEQLRRVLMRHLEQVGALRDQIVARAPVAIRERQEKLRTRVLELMKDQVVDESRLLQEASILAERADVTEELDRLQSHFSQFEGLIGAKDAVGRKMDFLIQEMNREANTVGSKCGDASLAHVVVDLKAELERMREQIQNVE